MVQVRQQRRRRQRRERRLVRRGRRAGSGVARRRAPAARTLVLCVARRRQRVCRDQQRVRLVCGCGCVGARGRERCDVPRGAKAQLPCVAHAVVAAQCARNCGRSCRHGVAARFVRCRDRVAAAAARVVGGRRTAGMHLPPSRPRLLTDLVRAQSLRCHAQHVVQQRRLCWRARQSRFHRRSTAGAAIPAARHRQQQRLVSVCGRQERVMAGAEAGKRGGAKALAQRALERGERGQRATLHGAGDGRGGAGKGAGWG
eukprot:132113-Chlamydomonas_euryale.AAC.7